VTPLLLAYGPVPATKKPYNLSFEACLILNAGLTKAFAAQAYHVYKQLGWLETYGRQSKPKTVVAIALGIH